MENNNEVQFNEAFASIKRINDLEEVLNSSFFSLLTKSEVSGLYGFETALSSLHNIFFTISGELTDDEIKECIKLKDLLDITNENKLFFSLSTIEGYGKDKKVLNLNQKLFNSFKHLLEDYRLLLTKLKKKHGFSNPNKESGELWD